MKRLVDEAARLSLKLDESTLGFEASRKINRLMATLEESPDDIELLETIETTFKILLNLISQLDLQTAQNVFFAIGREMYPEMNEKAASADQFACKWVEHFRNLAQYLGVRIE
jgi:uncharacterized protein YaaN involved in tellurite resistance